MQTIWRSCGRLTLAITLGVFGLCEALASGPQTFLGEPPKTDGIHLLGSYGSFSLGPNQRITEGNVFLIFQSDGNLVLYRNPGSGQTAIWNSGTSGHSCSSNCLAAFQSDGNLVLYQNGVAFWESHTSGYTNSTLVLSQKPPYLSIRGSDQHTYWFPKIALNWLAPLPYLGDALGAQDYPNLFSQPQQWSQARSRINVFKLYVWHVMALAPADLQNMISFLNANNIALAIEAPAINPTGSCGQNQEGYLDPSSNATPEALSAKIQAAGGTIDYIAMDEPIANGHYPFGNSCQLNMTALAQNIAGILGRYRNTFPSVITGDIEPFFLFNPYPSWPTDVSQFFDAFATANGAPLAFFHDDMVFSNGNWSGMIGQMQSILASKGIPYGFMVNGTQTDNTAHWVTAAKARTQTYRAMGRPTPDQVIFQTWDDFPDNVLPESSDMSLVSLINWYFTDPSANGGGPMSFYRLHNSSLSFLYTTGASEVASAQQGGWLLDGVAGFIYPRSNALPGLTPVYRRFMAANNDFFYTADPNEAAAAVSAGYQDQGLAGYALPAGDARGIPFYTSSSSTGRHFYSVDQNEAAGHGNLEGVRFSLVPF